MMKLIDILGTQYITNDYIEEIQFMKDKVFYGQVLPTNMWDTKLRDAVVTFKQEGRIELDLAGAAFTNKVWNELAESIQKLGDKFVVIDSEDDERDRFIQECRKIASQQLPPCVQLPPKPASVSDMVSYVAGLKDNVIYDVSVHDKCPAYITLIQLLRPSIQFRALNKDVFTYIKRVFTNAMHEEETRFKYILQTTDNYWETEVNEDGNVLIVNLGYIKKSEFLQKYVCIPWSIGEERFDPSKHGSEWKTAVAEVLEDVDEYLQKRPNTIAKYFSEVDGNGS